MVLQHILRSKGGPHLSKEPEMDVLHVRRGRQIQFLRGKNLQTLIFHAERRSVIKTFSLNVRTVEDSILFAHRQYLNNRNLQRNLSIIYLLRRLHRQSCCSFPTLMETICSKIKSKYRTRLISTSNQPVFLNQHFKVREVQREQLKKNTIYIIRYDL